MNIKADMLKKPLPLPYFDNLPRYLIPALQAAFDKAKGGAFGFKAIHASFAKDAKEVGHEPPAVPVMNQWVSGVQAGRIPRPGSAPAEKRAEAEFVPMTPAELSPPASKALEAIDKLTESLQGRIGTEAKVFSFDDLYERLIEEKVDELTKGARDEARRQVAEQLRQRLAELA